MYVIYVEIECEVKTPEIYSKKNGMPSKRYIFNSVMNENEWSMEMDFLALMMRTENKNAVIKNQSITHC